VKHEFALSLLLVVSAAATAPAQTKFSNSGKCGKPDVQQAAPAPDDPTHVVTIAQGKCMPVKPVEIAGSLVKEAAFAEHGEATGNNAHVWGTYAETLANGEKVFYHYESTAVTQNGALQTMQNKWRIVGGSAKLAGIKGQGTCKGKGTPDGGLAFDCEGEYTLAGK
jgi:hypothetical protein